MSDFDGFVMEQPKPKGTFWCPNCGKFAKFVSERHYYNGQFDCYSFDTDCKTCGIQTTECV